MARRIFVSYARRDRILVETLVSDLRGSGHDPFFDEGLTGGESWWDQLLQRIEDSDVFIPALTSEYLASEPCRLECDYAAALERPFLPVRLEAVSPRLCPPRIAEAQWVPYDPAQRNTILDLMRGLNGLRAAPALPDPRPPRPAVPISYLTDLKSKIESPGDMSRNDQVVVLAELKSRIDSDERADVQLLLQRLRRRPDLYFHVATDIDSLLAGGADRQGQQAWAGAASDSVDRTAQGYGAAEGHPPAQGYAAAPGHGVAPPPPATPSGSGQNPTHWPASGYGQASGQSQAGGYRPPQGGGYPPPPPLPPNLSGYPTGRQYDGRPDANKPPSHLVWTILATVFFCLPLGALGIYYSTQVDKKFFAGDVAGARLASSRAKNTAIIAAVTGVVLLILLVALAASNANSPSSPSGGF